MTSGSARRIQLVGQSHLKNAWHSVHDTGIPLVKPLNLHGEDSGGVYDLQFLWDDGIDW
jgi:hypothetical protein